MSTNQQQKPKDKHIRQTVSKLLSAVDRSIKAAEQVRKAKADLERLIERKGGGSVMTSTSLADPLDRVDLVVDQDIAAAALPHRALHLDHGGDAIVVTVCVDRDAPAGDVVPALARLLIDMAGRRRAERAAAAERAAKDGDQDQHGEEEA